MSFPLKIEGIDKETKSLIVEDLKDFKPPDGFGGMCCQTRGLTKTLRHICANVRPDGKVGNYIAGCPMWYLCKETGGSKTTSK